MTERLHEYFQKLEALAAPKATRIITGLVEGEVTTELGDVDLDLVELPACNSKRDLHKTFLAEIGWDVKVDSKGQMSYKRASNTSAVEAEEAIS
jgi:hypothetical protein